MGRKKITIEPITDERNRHVTFNKRKSGLIKKAMELSILCNCQISFLVFNAENQLFEYCSTDPRLILQQYCKVAHLPHERLSNADYPRFDKASRSSKGRKKGGDSLGNDDSDDMSNQGMSQGMNSQQVKEEQMMHMPGALQRRNSYVDPQHQMGGGQMMQPVIQVHQQQQQYDMSNNNQQSIQLQRRGSVSNIDQHLMSQIDLMTTPMTPNTVDRLMMQHQQQQQQHLDDNQGIHSMLPQQINFHQAQEAQQQQQQQMQQRNENGKRKHEDEEFSESKRHKMSLSRLQVPSNPQAVPLRRLEGNVDENQQQYDGGNNEAWQQQQQQQSSNTNGSTAQTLTSGLNENGESTPLNYMFSPITGMGNISTPMALTGADWGSTIQKSRDQQSS
ncbi:hypothetical protein AKO1_012942 [Acrasis kona]|uniref:MADS-box domain-containing protein n=1 Tax=Acrasis kona TaxID=1008807 RepID=A0AAW2YYU7_9EUKA